MLSSDNILSLGLLEASDTLRIDFEDFGSSRKDVSSDVGVARNGFQGKNNLIWFCSILLISP